MVCYIRLMATITPTITTDDAHEYRNYLELIASFADGVHIDFADGELAPARLLPLDKAWRHDDLITHIHVMYHDPLEVIDDIAALEADLVILHAESVNIKEALQMLQQQGIRTGIALLPETSVQDVKDLDIDDLFDHVLVFAGHLGYQGGKADFSQLDKVRQLKTVYPDVEIGWDGGVNDTNVHRLADAGVAILNVGGFIKSSKSPKKAYDSLVALLQS